MAAGLTATIYRPSIVVGDSRTGETQKFDGPYFVMQRPLCEPMVAVLPKVAFSPPATNPRRASTSCRATLLSTLSSTLAPIPSPEGAHISSPTRTH